MTLKHKAGRRDGEPDIRKGKNKIRKREKGIEIKSQARKREQCAGMENKAVEKGKGLRKEMKTRKLCACPFNSECFLQLYNIILHVPGEM